MISNTVMISAIKNTHCIICGEPFDKARASKLYCSKKCRQAAYYHKDKIDAIRKSQSKGISDQIQTFSMKEYKEYNRIRDRLRNYRTLQSHFSDVEEGSPAWDLLYKNPSCALTSERQKIPKQLWDARLPHLSIEQWSFIKSLYPLFNPTNFAELTCSLSSEFMNQIRSIDSAEGKKQHEKFQPIKNKYFHHLNKIVNGEINFI